MQNSTYSVHHWSISGVKRNIEINAAPHPSQCIYGSFITCEPIPHAAQYISFTSFHFLSWISFLTPYRCIRKILHITAILAVAVVIIYLKFSSATLEAKHFTHPNFLEKSSIKNLPSLESSTKNVFPKVWSKPLPFLDRSIKNFFLCNIFFLFLSFLVWARRDIRSRTART